MMNHNDIAGAVFDFGAFLTGRPYTITLGASHDTAPIIPLIREWAELRKLDTGAPNLEWDKETTP